VDDSRPIAIDLFAGAGGATVGYKKAGYEVVAAVEIDHDACVSYRLNHPTVPLWQRDIRRVKPADLLETLQLRPGRLDLLGACPPCQGFSRLRTRNRLGSVDDARNGLMSQFGRFAEGLLPKTLMLENVPSLLDDHRFARLVRKLERMGYSLSVNVVDASDYGVPQRRKRVILVGALGSAPPPLPRRALKPRTVRTAIAALPIPGASGDPLHDIPEQRSPNIRALIAAVPHDGGSKRDVPRRLLSKCHHESDGFSDVFGRMAWDEVAPTITSGCSNPSKGRFLHPEQDRAISLREAALLQTFPRRYKFNLARGKETVAAQIGNALPPELIRRFAESLLRNTTP